MTSNQQVGVQLMQTIFLGRYPIVAISCLTFYEWTLTASREVELIRNARWTSVKIMYLLCRYYPLLFWPVVSWAYVGDHDPKLCSQIVTPVQLFHVPLQIVPQGVMMMRAYAFTGRNKKILIGLSFGYIILIAVNLGVFITADDLPPASFYKLIGHTGCYPSYDGTMVANLGSVIIAATLMDGASLTVIFVHCYRTRCTEISLAKYFVLQGTHAFLFVFAVNVTAAVIYYFPGQPHTATGIPLFLALCNLIACRLVLQLRRKVYITDSEISRRNSGIVHDALATRCSSVKDPWLVEELPELEIPIYR